MSETLYTVKQIAEMAGVTVRTLHHYDAIDLLKPSQVGANGYRYYDEAALLRLQQILLYREMDMELAQIKAVLDDPDFDTLAALRGHRAALTQRIERTHALIRTIDQTIMHVAGEITMSKPQMFGGFSPEEEEQRTREARLQYDPDLVNESVQKWGSYNAAQKQAVIDEGNAIYEALAKAVADGLPVDGEVFQRLIERWHRHIQYFYEPTTDILRGLADMYNDSPDFRAKFDALHPDLAATMRHAVTHYVDALETAELERLFAEDEANRRLGE